MATPRLGASLLLRASRTTIQRSARQFKTLPSRTRTQIPVSRTPHIRFYSQQPKSSKIYFFEDIKTLAKSPSTSKILIDTREPSELQTTGTIPGAVNIPITTAPDAFFLSKEEFEDRFGFERPAQDKEVVFFCKAGVRSKAAAALAKQGGWETVGEYPGSWLDWEKNGGDKEGGRS